MDKLSGFQITSLKLSGFKSYLEPTEFRLGNPTIVTGGNGTGKSSLADAIAFVVTGLPFFGERGIDRLHCEDTQELFVAMRFTDGTGASHELTRSRMKSRMSITYDGYEIRQRDLTDLFGEKEVFLSIFNPLYFIEELGDNGKNLLERYLPNIPHEAVLAELNEEVREALKEESLLSPEGYLKRRREEMRSLEEQVVYLTGQKDLVETQRESGTQRIADLTERLSLLTAEIKALEEAQFSGMDLAGLREQLADLSAQYEELAQNGMSAADSRSARLQQLRWKMDCRKAEPYQPKYMQHIAEAAARAKVLGEQYSRKVAFYQELRSGAACPTCQRSIGDMEVDSVRETLKAAILDLGAKGKECTVQFNELRALEQKSMETFRQFQADDMAALEQEMQALSAGASDAGADDAVEQQRGDLSAIRQAMQELTVRLEYGNLDQEEYDRLHTAKEERQICAAELAALKSVLSHSAEEFSTQIDAMRAQILEKKKRIADVALYVSRRAELTFSQLKLNRVAISLYDVVKSTGEVKDVFRFTYNGRRYDRLSLSEKIRAGMEVSELMKRLTGRNYPVFIDNMESVEELSNIRPTGQVIMAKCVPFAELTVKAAQPAPVRQVQGNAA